MFTALAGQEGQEQKEQLTLSSQLEMPDLLKNLSPYSRKLDRRSVQNWQQWLVVHLLYYLVSCLEPYLFTQFFLGEVYSLNNGAMTLGILFGDIFLFFLGGGPGGKSIWIVLGNQILWTLNAMICLDRNLRSGSIIIKWPLENMSHGHHWSFCAHYPWQKSQEVVEMCKRHRFSVPNCHWFKDLISYFISYDRCWFLWWSSSIHYDELTVEWWADKTLIALCGLLHVHVTTISVCRILIY